MRISDWSSDVCSSALSERDGQTIREVKAIYPSPLNSIDLVTVPGAGGKIVEALQESLKESEAPSADPERKATPMEIAELDGQVDALTKALNGKIGRASCRERGCKYGEVPVVAG